ncbi:MAG: hypothetical protein WBX26_02035 [Candidatus Cybelea sp.]
MEATEKRPVPPYLSFTTLTNFIDGLGEHMPTRIDKSLMKSMSGASQSALVGALDYFGLRDGERPSGKLTALAVAEGPERAAIWKDLIQHGYPFLFKDGFNLKRATQGELDERFREAGVSGATIKKCVSFFMAAARVAGIEVSPHFKTIKTRAPRTRSSTAIRAKRTKREEKTTPPPQSQPVIGGSTKTIEFKSGGTATLTVSVDVVNLSPADRKALFELTDLMTAYEENNKGPVEATTSPKEGGDPFR